jgi:hypothetical protein
MEAHHEAQMAALRATHSPTPGGQSVSFIPNKRFKYNEIKLFPGARWQDLLHFLQQLRSRASLTMCGSGLRSCFRVIARRRWQSTTQQLNAGGAPFGAAHTKAQRRFPRRTL